MQRASEADRAQIVEVFAQGNRPAVKGIERPRGQRVGGIRRGQQGLEAFAVQLEIQGAAQGFYFDLQATLPLFALRCAGGFFCVIGLVGCSVFDKAVDLPAARQPQWFGDLADRQGEEGLRRNGKALRLGAPNPAHDSVALLGEKVVGRKALR